MGRPVVSLSPATPGRSRVDDGNEENLASRFVKEGGYTQDLGWLVWATQGVQVRRRVETTSAPATLAHKVDIGGRHGRLGSSNEIQVFARTAARNCSQERVGRFRFLGTLFKMLPVAQHQGRSIRRALPRPTTLTPKPSLLRTTGQHSDRLADFRQRRGRW